MSDMRFDELIAVRVALAGGQERSTTLADFFRAIPEIGPEARRDIRGALAAKITWCGGDPARPSWTIRRDDAADLRSAA